MRSGRARPAPRGPGLRPWLGAAGLSPFLPPSLPSFLLPLWRGSGLEAAGPAPRGAAPQRPGGRPRLGRRPGLSFSPPAPGHGPHHPARALAPPPPGSGPAPPRIARDFAPPRTAPDRVGCSPPPLFLGPSLPPRRVRRCLPLPGSPLSAPAWVLRDFPHAAGSRFPVTVPRPRTRAARRLRGAGVWGGGGDGPRREAAAPGARSGCPAARGVRVPLRGCPAARGAGRAPTPRLPTSPPLRPLPCPRNQEARVDGKFGLRK